VIRLKARELVNQAAIRGWDQRRMARACGVSEATISRALSGHAIRRVTLLRLVRALEDAPPIPQLQKLVEDAGWDNDRPDA
jgi:transcriptional regulator with XRE-family HTH domain